MRESCKYGSGRGARGNSRPYRDMTEKYVSDEIQSDDFRKMSDKVSRIQALIGKKRGQPLPAES